MVQQAAGLASRRAQQLHPGVRDIGASSTDGVLKSARHRECSSPGSPLRSSKHGTPMQELGAGHKRPQLLCSARTRRPGRQKEDDSASHRVHARGGGHDTGAISADGLEESEDSLSL